ncbi:MAG: AI-2E family transporter [Myxococcota bacterium]
MSDEKSPDAARTGVRRRQDTLWQTLRRFGRLWGFLGFLVFVVLLFRGIVLPFIFGVLIAYLLSPTVARLQPKIGRVLAVVSCYVVILGALGAFFGFLLPAVAKDFAKLRDTAPRAVETFNDEYLPRAQTWVDEQFGDFLAGESKPEPVGPDANSELIVRPLGDGTFAIDLENVQLAAEQREDGTWVLGPPQPVEERTDADLASALRRFLTAQTKKLGTVIGPALGAIVGGVTDFLTNFVITFMIAGFLLVDLGRVNTFIRGLVPYEYRGDFEELWASMDRGLGGVVRGQLLICLVNGVLTFIGMVLFGVKYSFLLAVLAGALSLIPIFGTIISSVPIIVIALVSSGEGLSFGPALAMLAWISGIHLLEANVLNPKIIGDSAHIHPVIVIFALLAGESVFGLVGALLAIPTTSLIQAFYVFMRRRSTVFAKDENPA